MLKHYDRYGFMAALAWWLGIIAIVGASFEATHSLLMALTHLNDRLAALLSNILILPLGIWLFPACFASFFLLVEKLKTLIGMRPNGTRKWLGQIVGYTGTEGL